MEILGREMTGSRLFIGFSVGYLGSLRDVGSRPIILKYFAFHAYLLCEKS